MCSITTLWATPLPRRNGTSRSGAAGATAWDCRVKEEAMAIRHDVRDYSAWRLVYDAHEPSRAGAGITDHTKL